MFARSIQTRVCDVGGCCCCWLSCGVIDEEIGLVSGRLVDKWLWRP